MVAASARPMRTEQVLLSRRSNVPAGAARIVRRLIIVVPSGRSGGSPRSRPAAAVRRASRRRPCRQRPRGMAIDASSHAVDQPGAPLMGEIRAGRPRSRSAARRAWSSSQRRAERLCRGLTRGVARRTIPSWRAKWVERSAYGNRDSSRTSDFVRGANRRGAKKLAAARLAASERVG